MNKEEEYYYCGGCEYDKIRYMDGFCPKCRLALEWSMVKPPSLPENEMIEKVEVEPSHEISISSKEKTELPDIEPYISEKKIEFQKKENEPIGETDDITGDITDDITGDITDDITGDITDDNELRTKIYDFVYSLKKNIISMSEHARVRRKYTDKRKKKIIKLYREIKHSVHNVTHNTECIYCKGKNARIVSDGPESVGCVCTDCNPPSTFEINYDFLGFLDKEDKNENN